MALMQMQNVRYRYDLAEDEQIAFVHELLRTEEETDFRPPHTQGYYEIIFCNSGFREVRVGKQVIRCGAGDILLISPGEWHQGRSLDCLLDRYTLHIGVSAFSLFGEQGAYLLRMFTERSKYSGNPLRLPPETASQVNVLLADTDKVLRMQGKRPLASVEALANIVKILVLLNQFCEEEKDPGTPSRLLLQILAYIESNYNRIDSAEEICREFAVSRSGLWRMFRQYMNQTPGEYIRRIRLENARYILEQGGSVTDACMECGFTDCSHFIRLFRDAYGVTPYRYKKEHSFVVESGGEV